MLGPQIISGFPISIFPLQINFEFFGFFSKQLDNSEMLRSTSQNECRVISGVFLVQLDFISLTFFNQDFGHFVPIFLAGDHETIHSDLVRCMYVDFAQIAPNRVNETVIVKMRRTLSNESYSLPWPFFDFPGLASLSSDFVVNWNQ